jgi:hypothetical protein
MQPTKKKQTFKETCSSGGHCYVGVCREDFDINRVNSSKGRWTAASNGAISIDGVWGQSTTYQAKDVITVVVNSTTREIRFQTNGKGLKFESSVLAFIKNEDIVLKLPENVDLQFICSVFYKGEKVRIVPNNTKTESQLS